MAKATDGDPTHKKKTNSPKGEDPSQLDDWRGATLSLIRTLIEQADPDVVEEQKWKKVAIRKGFRSGHMTA